MNCRKIDVCRNGAVVLGACLASAVTLSGCVCRFYTYDVNAEGMKNGVENYTVVDSLTMDEYPQSLPVTVSITESSEKSDSGLGPVLWFFTFGVIPGWDCYTTTYNTTISSPIGTRSGSCSVTKTEMMGWLPIFLPYSHEGSNKERLAKDALQKNLISQFSRDEYAIFAKTQNEARHAELVRIESVQRQVHDLIAKNLYSEAAALIATESSPRAGSKDSDAAKWSSLRWLTQEKAEDFRVANKKADLDKKFVARKFEDVVTECEKERNGEERHAAIWRELRDKAVSAISERDRKIELVRIEKRKSELERLLGEKKYAEVIAECDKETGMNAGSRHEDSKIWHGFRCKAKIEKDKIDRAAEEKRIAQKFVLVNQLLAEKKFAEVVTLCDEERGQHPGSRSEDLMQWKSIRSKALADDLLLNIDERSKDGFCLKGFYLGMSVEEVDVLLNYYFPSLSHSYNGTHIDIAGQVMHFCETSSGRVTRMNFSKKMLEKWFDYDAQSEEEWIACFEKVTGLKFKPSLVKERKSHGGASISVSQVCFTHRNPFKGFKVSYFGEKDVEDYNKDPKEIEDEAFGRAWSIGDNEVAYQIGVSAGIAAANVKKVRAWVNEEYDNGRGAASGTLRIERLDE